MRAIEGDGTDLEWEANDFASELLMPAKQFAADVAQRDVSIATARTLADESCFDVSVTAATRRLVQVSKEQCAIVVSSGGHIEWAYRSDSLRIPGLRRGASLSADSLASHSFRSGDSELQPLEVDVNSWLEPRYPLDGKLFESTHVIRSLGQVVSLLWLVQLDADDDE
jgi:hypothetical protein